MSDFRVIIRPDELVGLARIYMIDDRIIDRQIEMLRVHTIHSYESANPLPLPVDALFFHSKEVLLEHIKTAANKLWKDR